MFQGGRTMAVSERRRSTVVVCTLTLKPGAEEDEGEDEIGVAESSRLASVARERSVWKRWRVKKERSRWRS